MIRLMHGQRPRGWTLLLLGTCALGAIVADVAIDAPQGLRRGDVILQMDGTAVTGVGDLERRMQAVPKGEAAHLSVQRGVQRIPVQFAASEPEQH